MVSIYTYKADGSDPPFGSDNSGGLGTGARQPSPGTNGSPFENAEEPALGAQGGVTPPPKLDTRRFTEGNETYEGVRIDHKNFTEPELNDLKKTLDFLGDHPDGAKLLSKLRKEGFSIVRDPGLKNAIAETRYSEKQIALGSGTFGEGKGYVLEVMGHELTHAVTQELANTPNEEALGSTLGRRIRFDYEGEFAYRDAAGKEVTFDGSKEAEELSYRNGMQTAAQSEGLKDLERNTFVFNGLADLGIHFTFGPQPPSWGVYGPNPGGEEYLSNELRIRLDWN